MKKFVAILMVALLTIPMVFALNASAASTLVSKNKSYTISGSGKGYQVYSANLTDGEAPADLLYDSTWFGFYYHVDNPDSPDCNAPGGIGDVTIDLGKVTKGLNKFRTHICPPGVSGIGNPSAVVVSVSNDGKKFTTVGSFDPVDDSTSGVWMELSTKPAEGRYVRFSYTIAKGVFVFLNEVEVYADPDAVVDETSEPVDESEPIDESKPVDETSEPAVDETSAPVVDETSAAPTGDDGISTIVFAIIALVAVTGSAVVIRTRR